MRKRRRRRKKRRRSRTLSLVAGALFMDESGDDDGDDAYLGLGRFLWFMPLFSSCCSSSSSSRGDGERVDEPLVFGFLSVVAAVGIGEGSGCGDTSVVVKF